MFCKVMVACLIGCTGPRAQLHVDTEWKHVHACATIRHLWMEENFALGIYMKCKIVWEPIVQVCSWFFFLILLIWIVLFLVNILYVRADTETLDVKYLQILEFDINQHDIKAMIHYVPYLELHRCITQNVKTDPTSIPNAMPTDNEKGWILMTSMK